MSAFGDVRYAAGGSPSTTLSARMLGRRYGPRPARIETHDRRDVDAHIDEDAAGQA